MTFTLAHLSDPHLPPMPAARPRDLAGKRALGYLNYTSKRRVIHRRDVLDLLVADLEAQHPDHIAVTGDLINIALEAEFAPARAWLASLGTPDRVSLVPGNHDAYVRATQSRHAQCWGDYARNDDTGSGAADYPYVRRRGAVTLIGVSSAVPTAPFMATGRLGEAQRGALQRILAALASEHAFRVLLIHHPLRSEASHKRLTDAKELRALLRRYGVELVLHGHDHVHETVMIDGPTAPIPVVGVPSASAFCDGHRPNAAYNLFAIARDGAAWRCTKTTRGIDATMRMEETQRVALY